MCKFWTGPRSKIKKKKKIEWIPKNIKINSKYQV